MSPLQSLIACGSKVWLDSIEPNEVQQNRGLGITGATSNPIIISDVVQKGELDKELTALLREGLDDEAISWRLTDTLVSRAQTVFEPVWDLTRGDDGWASFELDPLLEDPANKMTDADKTARYVDLARHWSIGHKNRMIKVPATPAGIAAMEDIVAGGVTVNVTLVFSERQYIASRDACWRGAQRRMNRDTFKSVYSIFVSRLDVYTEKHVPDLSPAAQGMVGIVNAKRIWEMNQKFWADKALKLKQEMIFASTGVKKAGDPPWKYVEAFAGSDIMTNPPKTNAEIEKSGRAFKRKIDELPPQEVLKEIDRKVDFGKLEEVLMREGAVKFADPQKSLIQLIATRRKSS